MNKPITPEQMREWIEKTWRSVKIVRGPKSPVVDRANKINDLAAPVSH
jgi:hypothetical protein